MLSEVVPSARPARTVEDILEEVKQFLTGSTAEHGVITALVRNGGETTILFHVVSVGESWKVKLDWDTAIDLVGRLRNKCGGDWELWEFHSHPFGNPNPSRGDRIGKVVIAERVFKAIPGVRLEFFVYSDRTGFINY